MESGAKIVVDNGATLATRQQTVFFGCTAMWNAIEIGLDGGYDLVDTEIRNGIRGLVLLRGNKASSAGLPNTCKVQNCTFRNNYVGLTVDYAAGTSGGTHFTPLLFAGNTFVKDGAMLWPYTDSIQTAGAFFRACSLGYLNSGNTFDGVRISINVYRSVLLITGNTFKNHTSIGIIAKKTLLRVQQAAFENTYEMITCLDARHTEVRNCTLTDGGIKGIRIANTNIYKSPVLVNNNTLEFSRVPQYAIQVDRSPWGNTSGHMQNQIDNNDILVHGTHSTSGVLIDVKAPTGGGDNFPITRNRIMVDATLSTNGQVPTCHGIYLTQSSSGLDVSQNELSYQATNTPGNASPNLGISFVNLSGQRNRITDNTVNATLFSLPSNANEERASWMKCAYHVDNAPNLVVCSNTGDETYRLFHFSGSLNYCDFALNDMQTHYYGLLCQKMPGSPNTNMGPQDWHENTWLTTASSYEKRSAYYQDPYGMLPFTFKVYPGIPAQNPPGALLNPPKVAPLGWFQAVNPATGQQENSSCVANDSTILPTGLDGWDGDIIAGTYPYESAAQDWDMKRGLLHKLILNPAFRPTSSPAETWYNSQTSSSAWQFADFERRYYEAFEISTAAETGLDTVRTAYENLARQLVVLDSLQNVDMTTDDATIRQQQQSTADELAAATDTLQARQTQVNTGIQAALTSLQSDWSNLPDTAAWEINRKRLYAVWLKYGQGAGFTDSDYDVMRAIASECPLYGGMAVREIPMFLPDGEANDYTKEDYWATCSDTSQYRENAVGQLLQAQESLIAYPNPATGQITLFAPAPAEPIAWAIIAMSGRISREGAWPSGQRSVIIDTAALPAGLYIGIARTHDGQPRTVKFSIQH